MIPLRKPEPSMDQQDFLNKASEIIELLEDLPEDTYAKGSEFFDSVREKIDSMSNSVEQGLPVTQRMQIAMENMEAGVRKWARD